MKRRHFVASVLGTGLLAPNAMAVQDQDHQGHGDQGPRGDNASVTVSFGAWPQINRLSLPPGPPPNVHHMFPHEVVVKQGGTVNFIVAGLHQIVVYEPPKRVEDVNFLLTEPTPGAPAGIPPMINDPVNRVFRGVFAFSQSQDRVEVVHFPNRGKHLVICGFQAHFNAEDKMFGWVRVV